MPGDLKLVIDEPVDDTNRERIERLLTMTCVTDNMLTRMRSVRILLDNQPRDEWGITLSLFDMMVAAASAVKLLRQAKDAGWMRREFIIEHRNITDPPVQITHMCEAWDMICAAQETELGQRLSRMFRVRNKLLAHHDLDVAQAFVRDHADYITEIPFSITKQGVQLFESEFRLSRFLLLDAIGAPLAEQERLLGNEIVQHARESHAIVMKIHNLMIYLTLAYKKESGIRFRAVETDADG